MVSGIGLKRREASPPEENWGTKDTDFGRMTDAEKDSYIDYIYFQYRDYYYGKEYKPVIFGIWAMEAKSSDPFESRVLVVRAFLVLSNLIGATIMILLIILLIPNRKKTQAIEYTLTFLIFFQFYSLMISAWMMCVLR